MTTRRGAGEHPRRVLVVDLEFVTGLPVLFATANLAITGTRRTVVTGAAAAAAVVVSMPYAHGDHTTVAAGLARDQHEALRFH